MKFKVKTEIHRDGVVHKPGSTIELDPKEAEAMPWAVEAIPEPPKEEKPKK